MKAMDISRSTVILVYLCVQVQGKCETLLADKRLQERFGIEGTYTLIPNKLCRLRETYKKDDLYLYYGGRLVKTLKPTWVISAEACKNEYQEVIMYARYTSASTSPVGTWEDLSSHNNDKIYISCSSESDDNIWVWYLSLGGASAMVIIGGILIGWCILRKKKSHRDVEMTNLPAAMVTNSDEVSPFA